MDDTEKLFRESTGPGSVSEYQRLFDRAGRGDANILKHPAVAFFRDRHGWTPLHVLAARAEVAVLEHPCVASVRDDEGVTPLHVLADVGIMAVATHPESATVRNMHDETPLDILDASKASPSPPNRVFRRQGDPPSRIDRKFPPLRDIKFPSDLPPQRTSGDNSTHDPEKNL